MKTIKFRIKKKWMVGDSYYLIQKKHWFGWWNYDSIDYFTLETAKARLKEIKDNYPNVRPKKEKVIDEIEINITDHKC